MFLSSCTNGECIDLRKKCDNERNCFDKSDEICHAPSKFFYLVKIKFNKNTNFIIEIQLINIRLKYFSYLI